jgi:hypothetical protein
MKLAAAKIPETPDDYKVSINSNLGSLRSQR